MLCSKIFFTMWWGVFCLITRCNLIVCWLPLILSQQKKDPAQFLQVHGRAYKIHLDPAVALAAESPINMWGDTHTHTHTRHHIRCTVCVGSHWSDWTSLLFCEKDAVAGRCQQHDWQVWCEGSPGLHPHLHTSTAQHIVSPKMKCHTLLSMNILWFLICFAYDCITVGHCGNIHVLFFYYTFWYLRRFTEVEQKSWIQQSTIP